MVLTLRRKTVEIVLLSSEKSIQIGDSIYRMKDNLGRSVVSQVLKLVMKY
jgi:F0F1-type ATP synthase alpha subunit